MVTFKQQMSLDAKTFANVDEFGELATYMAPNGTITNNVLVVIARQTFVQEFDNVTAGLGASIAIEKGTITKVEPHGRITVGSEVFTVQMIYAIDDVFITVNAISDARISPQGMR
jgi:hypothetical protein